MKIPQKVSRTLNVVVLATGGVTPHLCVSPPQLPAPTLWVHFEIPTPVWWPPGMALGQNKFAASVKHRGQSLALDGHDCGVCILHVAIPFAPPNYILPLHILFSKRKMMFSASTVRMVGSPAGTSDLLSFPTPMLACAQPVSMPIGFPLTNALNTVNVGVSVGDLAAGYFAIALTMIVDWLMYGKPKAIDDLWRFLGTQFLGKLGGDWNSVVKGGLGIWTGLVKIAFTGQGSIDVTFGSPFGQIRVGIERKAGKWAVKGSARWGPLEGTWEAKKGGASVGGSVSNPAGKTTVKIDHLKPAVKKEKLSFGAPGDAPSGAESARDAIFGDPPTL